MRHDCLNSSHHWIESGQSVRDLGTKGDWSKNCLLARTVRIKLSKRNTTAGLSLVEALIGILVVGIAVGALYTAFTQGIVITQMAREDSRATQILLEKCETLRLCGWSQLVSNGVPANFTALYDPQSEHAGAVYEGSVTIADSPMNTSYQTNLKQVRIRVAWKTGGLARERELKTFVARYGLQTYVY